MWRLQLYGTQVGESVRLATTFDIDYFSSKARLRRCFVWGETFELSILGATCCSSTPNLAGRVGGGGQLCLSGCKKVIFDHRSGTDDAIP